MNRMLVILALLAMVGCAGQENEGSPDNETVGNELENTITIDWVIGGTKAYSPSYVERVIRSTFDYSAAYVFSVNLNAPQGIESIQSMYVTRDFSDHVTNIVSDGYLGNYNPVCECFETHLYSEITPHSVNFDGYTIHVIDKSGNLVSKHFSISRPNKIYESEFVYTKEFQGSTEKGMPYLETPSITNVALNGTVLHFNYQLADSRVKNAQIWFFDNLDNFIGEYTFSGEFMNYGDANISVVEGGGDINFVAEKGPDDIANFVWVSFDSLTEWQDIGIDDWWNQMVVGEYCSLDTPNNTCNPVMTP